MTEHRLLIVSGTRDDRRFIKNLKTKQFSRVAEAPTGLQEMDQFES